VSANLALTKDGRVVLFFGLPSFVAGDHCARVPPKRLNTRAICPTNDHFGQQWSGKTDLTRGALRVSNRASAWGLLARARVPPRRIKRRTRALSSLSRLKKSPASQGQLVSRTTGRSGAAQPSRQPGYGRRGPWNRDTASESSGIAHRPSREERALAHMHRNCLGPS